MRRRGDVMRVVMGCCCRYIEQVDERVDGRCWSTMGGEERREESEREEMPLPAKSSHLLNLHSNHGAQYLSNISYILCSDSMHIISTTYLHCSITMLHFKNTSKSYFHETKSLRLLSMRSRTDPKIILRQRLQIISISISSIQHSIFQPFQSSRPLQHTHPLKSQTFP